MLFVDGNSSQSDFPVPVIVGVVVAIVVVAAIIVVVVVVIICRRRRWVKTSQHLQYVFWIMVTLILYKCNLLCNKLTAQATFVDIWLWQWPVLQLGKFYKQRRPWRCISLYYDITEHWVYLTLAAGEPNSWIRIQKYNKETSAHNDGYNNNNRYIFDESVWWTIRILYAKRKHRGWVNLLVFDRHGASK